mgnify:CR=1 FL=1
MVKQGVSKEEREAGNDGAILGNAKNGQSGERPKDAGMADQQSSKPQPLPDGDDVPF